MTKEIETRLAELTMKNGGTLTPEAVVEDAKQKDSPLHSMFEWDTKKAAYQHWLDVARGLIRSVRVEVHIESRKVSTVAYVRDPKAPHDQQGYVRTATLRSDTDLAREALEQEFARITAAMHRARELSVFFGLKDELESMIATLGEFRERLAA